MEKQKLDINWDRLIRETEEIAESNRIKREEETKLQPLFTLTAEETKFVKYVLGRYERDYVKDEYEYDMLWQVQQKIKEYQNECKG